MTPRTFMQRQFENLIAAIVILAVIALLILIFGA